MKHRQPLPIDRWQLLCVVFILLGLLAATTG